MSTDFISLLKPLEGFKYKSHQLFKYCNETQQYYISKSSSGLTNPQYWGVNLCCSNGIQPVYNYGSLSLFAQCNNISFEQAKIIRKQISSIKTSTRKEAHEKVMHIFHMHSSGFGNTVINHQLKRGENFYNPFFLFYKNDAFIGSNCLSVTKLHKNSILKQDKYILKEDKIKTQLKYINVSFPRDFNSKPELIRFLYQTVASHLPALYYLQKNNLSSELWWRFFLQENIDLDVIF